MKILVFDNYDSFTYNLVHLVEKILHQPVDVVRNDQLPLEALKDYDKIILSPGPGVPAQAGMLIPLIHEYAASKSMLGVCLGHQAIGEAFGGKLVNLQTVFHGVAPPINIVKTNAPLFAGIEGHPEVGRYHSWIVDKESLPATLQVTAEDDNGYVMAMQHTQFDVQGVQFHPESILTPCGETIMRNWLKE